MSIGVKNRISTFFMNILEIISKKNIKKYFILKNIVITLSFFAIFMIFFQTKIDSINADPTLIYATDCLNKINEIENKQEILCKGFKGKIPKGKESAVTLNFSWVQENKAPETEIKTEIEKIKEKIKNETSSLVQIETTPELPIESIQANIEENNETVVTLIFEEENIPLEIEMRPELPIESIQANIEESNETFIVNIFGEESTDSIIIQKPETEIEKISLFENIFSSIVYAQEESIQGNIEESNETFVTSIFEEENIPQEIETRPELPIESIQANIEEGNETIVTEIFAEDLTVEILQKKENSLDIHEELDIFGETELKASSTKESLFEVYYSTNGETFISLGQIYNFNTSSIKLPVSVFTEANNLSELQISLRALNNKENKQVNFDKMWLELKGSEKEIVIDSLDIQNCEEEEFIVNITDNLSLDKRIIVRGDNAGLYEAQIGKLPNKVSLKSEKKLNNNYKLGAQETEIMLHIENKNNSGFTIPIIYKKKGDNPASVICLIKFVNQYE